MTDKYIFYIIIILLVVNIVISIARLLKKDKTEQLENKMVFLQNELEDYIDKNKKDTLDFMERQQKLQSQNQQTVQNLETMRFKEFSDNTQNNITTLRRTVAEMATGLDDRFAAFQKQNEEKLSEMRATLEKKVGDMQESNEKKLDEMRQTVDEKLQKTLEDRINQSFKLVSERLEQVYKSLGEVHSLASGVGDLKRMLSNVKTRGVWGEIQLGALLEQALTDSQYQRNVAVVPHSNERVEFAICLPGREDGSPVYLPIDSKFPQEDYARLSQAAEEGSQQDVEAAQKALLAAVRTEAKRIGKYIAPPYTTDFAVMFLPIEGLYAEVMRHSEAVEAIQREQRILIAGPSTLLALLNSLQMGFRTLAIEKRSAEVWKLLGAVKTDFSSFAALLHKTQEKLQQATDSIDSAFVKTRNIEKRLRRVEALDTDEAQKMLSDDVEG